MDEMEARVEPKAKQPTVKQPTAAELLAQAAELLDKQDGPRAEKFYRNLAAQVRQLAARL